MNEILIDQLKNKNHINKKEFKAISDDLVSKRCRKFYITPKIHKQTWTKFPNIPPGRPIISDCGTESSKVAAYIDFYLNPIAQKAPSYIRDSTDVIANLLEYQDIHTMSDILLFTWDVESLYTNIPVNEALNIVEMFLNQNSDVKTPSDIILQLLYTQMFNNDFTYKGKNYIQHKGVAMGKTFAPSIANL